MKLIPERLPHPFFSATNADTAAYKSLFALTLFLLLDGCSKPVKTLYPPLPGNPQNKSVTVVNHGKHSGIILSQKDAAEHLRVFEDFAEARYLEIGWGDEKYYQAKVVTSAMALKAAFWPTGSVLQVVSVPAEPTAYFPDKELVVLELSDEGFRNLVGFVDGTFARDSRGELIPLGKGLYGESRFYRANGTFHLFNNCNAWTAKALRAAGFPVSTFYVYTSDNLFYQLERYKTKDR